MTSESAFMQGPGDLPLERLFPDAKCTEPVDTMMLLEFLRAKRLCCIKDLIYLPPWELSDWLLITEDDACKLICRAWAACAAKPVTAWDLTMSHAPRQSRMAPLPSLQEALGNLPALIEVAGPPAVGKTQFCLNAAALTAASGGEVFWLDTERSFSAPRLLEMLEHLQHGEAAMHALQRVRHKVCDSLQELHSIISELSKLSRTNAMALPSLLIIDSVAELARREGTLEKSSIPRRQAALSNLASLLKVLVAPQVNVEAASPTVVVTNQVMGDLSGTSRVSLGHVWHHSVNWRLVLSHVPPGAEGPGSKEQADPSGRGRRYLLVAPKVEKSPCCASRTIPFNITERGLNELRPT